MELRGKRAVGIGVRDGVSGAAVEMAELILQSGDQSYAGPPAGVALEVPTFHVLDPEIMAQLDPSLVERELALPALAMDAPQVIALFQATRKGN